MKKRVLFVCSWNSCRSQMAEGFGRTLAGEDFEVKSAGINAGGVNADAIAAMREIGVDISAQTSDRLTAAHYAWADYIVTVCDAARDNCPIVPAGAKSVHWSVRDPYGDHLDEATKESSFREVRNELRDRIVSLFERIRQGEI